MRQFRLGLLAATLAALSIAGASAHPPTRAAAPGPSLYAPYEPLIGTWAIAKGDGTPVGISRFNWGTGRSYIWIATALTDNGREVPHFEGMLMWNGVNRNLDMLVAIDLEGGRAQESGTFAVAPDGSFVRDHVAIFTPADGRPASRATFRQTYRLEGRDRIVTSVVRQTPNGWAPTFPGSDHLVMTRRPDGQGAGS